MDHKPKVSVIIPVYNTANYLVECLDSLLGQSLSDFEVLIMDDGSTDNSNEILEGYRNRDSRIQLFHQSNSGQSVARNFLINLAKGEYIYFMDSDDILVNEAMKSCYERAKLENLDIVTFDADIIYEGNQTPLSYDYHRSGLIPKKTLKGDEMFQITVKNGSYRAAPWLLFVKRETLVASGVRFFPGIIHEDELFTPQLYIAANRVSYIPQIFFIRRVRASSTMTKSFSEKNFYGYMTVISELSTLSKNLGSDNRGALRIIIRDVLSVVAYNSNSLNGEMRRSLLRSIFKENFLFEIPVKSLFILLFPFSKSVNKGLKKRIVS
jgi:glycosyltransferase involved in cell wall biosynthesis